MTPEFNLELLNGNWGIASLALAVICCFYFTHEWRARRRERTKVTQGMRIAVAVFTMSGGVFIRSAEVWRWRFGGGDLRDLSQDWLTLGGVIAIVGFLCAIREISSPLYGRAPWLLTLAAMVIFNAGSMMHRLM